MVFHPAGRFFQAYSFMRCFLLLLLLFVSSSVLAECKREISGLSVCGRGPCATDINGKVYCARHRDGAAIRDSQGKVVCGLGRCARDVRDNIYCSVEPGGGASRNLHGEVECFGGCRLADQQLCERVIATQ
jgi:hypothetical protein